jgi:hypothetical protein
MEKKTEFKNDCNFRRRLRQCNFKVEQCRPREEGLDWGDFCHLYGLPWDAKKLRKKINEMQKEAKALEKTLKHLKKNDRDEYKITKKKIKDLFLGSICISQAIRYIKRSGNMSLNKSEQRVADVLIKKLKDDKKD